MTATFTGDGFLKAAAADPEKVKIYTDPRGSAKNVGGELSSVHPVVRTNPVTGWKSIYALGSFPKRINELHQDESDEILAKFKRVIYENHDITVRFKWRNENDIGENLVTPSEASKLKVANYGAAIWDNRSAFHTATFDYDGLGERFGNRAVGIGEAPYLDSNSTSRAVALGLEH